MKGHLANFGTYTLKGDFRMHGQADGQTSRFQIKESFTITSIKTHTRSTLRL